jgi:hypothetical protein
MPLNNSNNAKNLQNIRNYLKTAGNGNLPTNNNKRRVNSFLIQNKFKKVKNIGVLRQLFKNLPTGNGVTLLVVKNIKPPPRKRFSFF